MKLGDKFKIHEKDKRIWTVEEIHPDFVRGKCGFEVTITLERFCVLIEKDVDKESNIY